MRMATSSRALELPPLHMHARTRSCWLVLSLSPAPACCSASSLCQPHVQLIETLAWRDRPSTDPEERLKDLQVSGERGATEGC